jgi:pimeloyl-ACP methyl ester carboxylesterase
VRRQPLPGGGHPRRRRPDQPGGSRRALAEATGGALVVLEGAGHIPLARDPVKVNLLIREFVESLAGRTP